MSYEQAERNYLQPPDGPDMDLLREQWGEHVYNRIGDIAQQMAFALNDGPKPIAPRDEEHLAEAIASYLRRSDVSFDEIAQLAEPYEMELSFDEWLAKEEADEEGRRDDAAMQKAELRAER